MIPTRSVEVARYAPGEDSHGAPVDAWAAAEPVDVYGWSPASRSAASGGSDAGNRRVVAVELDVLAPNPVGNDRARWTLPGEPGVFEQQGEPANYGHGPWWESPGVVITVRQVEG